MAIRVTGMLIVLAMSACGGDDPPPTREDVLAACEDMAHASCEKFGECLGWTATEVDDCIAGEVGRCPDELEAETCWENQLDNYVDCTTDTSEASCADTCNADGFCFVYCPYFCPTE